MFFIVFYFKNIKTRQKTAFLNDIFTLPLIKYMFTIKRNNIIF